MDATKIKRFDVQVFELFGFFSSKLFTEEQTHKK